MSGKVFDELTCPECGGRIGLSSDSTLPGQKPCTCFEVKPQKRRLPDEPDPVDMVPLVSTATDPTDPHAPRPDGKKLCRVCGKNLAGRSRLKDSKGYICKTCSDTEYEAEAEAERDAIECPECHRKLKAGGFVEWRGNLICKRCHSHHQENDRLKVAKLGELTLHNKEEKKSALTLTVICGVLALMLAVKTFIIGW